jgi:hypothetical protein
MIGLSDSQLEIIISEAESMADDSCQDFLERVAAILHGRGQQVRGKIDNDDVSMAVRQALRELIHSSDVWKNWKRNSFREDELRFEAPFADAQPALNASSGAWRWLWYFAKQLLSSAAVPAH